jgi:redox-sensitive bicupin YhaK (pirin superfamily)
MDRKHFIRKSLLGTGMLVGGSAAARLIQNSIDELQPPEPIGFNHLPSETPRIMSNMVLHKAATRGHANHGWLDTYHTFSFANYYDPERMHFGVLRVLNDDTVAAGRGFGTHPHDNMEIVSIPLQGDLEHKDSMGNTQVIRQGDIQVMSAGSGITHSENNRNADQLTRFLQIWVFPNKRNVAPRYDQLTLNPTERRNRLQQVLSPDPHDDGVWIHQDAWFHLGSFDAGKNAAYDLKRKGNGVYVFMLEGSAVVNDQVLERRDGLGIWDVDRLELSAGNDGAEVLMMEVPMQLN